MDMYSFYTGKIFDAYEYLGCHIEKDYAIFRTYAPNAVKISVIGDFNCWQETEMHKVYDGNFWECEVAGARVGEKYKFRIYEKGGKAMDHCDPYGYGMELRPNTASIIRDMNAYHFSDSKWMRSRTDRKNEALNIYEVHVGSWRKKDGSEEGWYNYTELSELLLPYVKENGYNYIELMPILEHPCDNSWGYQSTGFFSPTSRYGTADDLKKFINACHSAEIGVILDFVPVHFAVDDYALANYDGTALYEYPNSDVGYSEWGSKNFIHSRGEVQSFLQSSANYWLKEYHFDGLRMDAISNMVFWQGNKERGINQNAVSFIKYMNQGLKKMYPSIILAAEDSTSFEKVTDSVENGGLGFDYKWDMGWMNDTLDYFQLSPKQRAHDYHKLTFSMMYFYKERFLLPLSHDETVHGKATIVQKMNGRYEEKFPQARAFYMYMYAHPGKKLNFMGNEIGQLREWDEKREQDWDMLKYPVHDSFHTFMEKLNEIYLKNPALYADDYNAKGFEWLDCHSEEHCVYAFLRKGKQQTVVAVFNFSDEEVRYALPARGFSILNMLLDSNWECFGGHVPQKKKEYKSVNGNIQMKLEAFSAQYFIAEMAGA